jgi:hypothetical protein
MKLNWFADNTPEILRCKLIIESVNSLKAIKNYYLAEKHKESTFRVKN